MAHPILERYMGLEPIPTGWKPVVLTIKHQYRVSLVYCFQLAKLAKASHIILVGELRIELRLDGSKPPRLRNAFFPVISTRAS